MDEKEFSSDVIENTIKKLNASSEWIQPYSDLFKSLLDSDKLSNSTEIYKKVMEEVID